MMSLLCVSCSSDDDSGEPTGGEAEVAIVSSGDVEFSFDDSARFYASSTNKMYGEGELNGDYLKPIESVENSNQAFITFSSPSDETTFLPNVTATKIQTKNASLTTTEFDAMEDDA
ncbi:hypothetical protein BD809_11431 [Aquimarina intermedia]|uniref:Uncharacterized protein n=2 Tax=Aquimarina intermedia TaxID=350814 RepID=A0A5S5BS55_9FLAO|nr:hypothetical protein BD809_11431 [Aquimarina intermedia]